MKGYIKKQSLMDFCDNTANKTIDNNDIARFPVSPVIEIDRVLETIDKVSHKASARGQFWTAEKTIKVLRRDVLALKGEQG